MRVLGFTAQGTATDVAFTVQLLAGAQSPPKLLTADITAHNEIQSHWVASFPISRQVDTDIWSGAVSWSPEEAPGLLSLAGLQIPPMPPDVGSIPPTMPESVAVDGDFIVKKPDGDGTGHWLDGSARLKDLVATRESYFDAELRAPSAAATDPLWCVAILAEHVLLTSHTRVPGLRILPLQPNTKEDRLAATAGLLTALAAEVGMTTPGRITFNANDRPLTLWWRRDFEPDRTTCHARGGTFGSSAARHCLLEPWRQPSHRCCCGRASPARWHHRARRGNDARPSVHGQLDRWIHIR